MTEPSYYSKLSRNRAQRVAWKVRVLIVDDHPLFRAGLKDLLQNESTLEVCGEAADASEVLEQVRATRAELVTVDISLASGNGLDVIKQIRRHAPEIKTLVLSMHEDRTYAVRALNAGALGYVCKQVAPEEILRAISKVRAGGIYLSDAMLQRLLHHNVGSAQSVSQIPTDVLSDRELEVFRLIGLGRSTQQIAAELCLAQTTIETYRARLKAKLSLASSNELTRQALLWMLRER